MKIAVDASGADYSPDEIVKGAAMFASTHPRATLVLFGAESEISASLPSGVGNVEIVDAPETITNADAPALAVRRKKSSSLTKALEFVRDDPDAVALVSAGSTGAVLTGAVLFLRRIRGIIRPALCPALPTVVDGKSVLLMDCGAIADPKPANLVQYALMSSVYSRCAFGIESPRVALLNNGAEAGKGDELHKAAYPLLASCPGIDFVGNVEGRDILSGAVDAVVSDGFSGNVCLKSCEGVALALFDILKREILSGGPRAKLGYLLLKPALKRVKKKMDYNENGGAVLLGLDKIVIKSHGSSKAKAISNSIAQALSLHESRALDEISAALAEYESTAP